MVKGEAMLIRRKSDILGSEITPPEVYARRRDFLRTSAMAGLGLAAGTGWSWSTPEVEAALPGTALEGVQASPLSTDEPPTEYAKVTAYNNFYEFGTGKGDPAENANTLKPRPWSIAVSGHCNKTGEYALEDLIREVALEERIYRLRCVEAWSMVVPWVGVPLAKVLARLEPTSDAKYVEFTTLNDPEQMPGLALPVIAWPYREGLRIDEAMHPLSLLAIGLYGRVLPNQNGAPIRLVVPWKYGFKSIKSIVAIRFSATQPRTSWNDNAPQEYGFFANVNPAHDHPRWSQAEERRIGEFFRRDTLPFNGYAEQVAQLYSAQDLHRDF
jgi:methionine sulfoxide reductase catalytic subunit